MKILVIGVYYANNLGDAVICDCVASRLQAHFPKAQIRVVDVRDRHDFQKSAQVSMETMEKGKKRAWIRHTATSLGIADKEYKHEMCRLSGSLSHIEKVCQEDYDLAVFAGGQLFQDGFALFLREYVKYLEAKQIPVIFNACGTGPSWSRRIQKELAETLNASCVRLVSTRDNKALIEKRYLKGQKEAVSVTDPALWTREVYGISKDPDTQVVGLGIMYATSVNLKAETKFWVRMVQFLEQQKIAWEFFVNGDFADAAYAKYVFSQIPNRKDSLEDHMAPIPTLPKELVSTIARYKSIISFRLHSHVLAASLQIPGVAMVWDEKLKFFYEKLNYPERCMTVKNTPKQVYEMLCQAEEKGYANSHMEEQRARSEQILLQAAEDIMKEKEKFNE